MTPHGTLRRYRVPSTLDATPCCHVAHITTYQFASLLRAVICLANVVFTRRMVQALEHRTGHLEHTKLPVLRWCKLFLSSLPRPDGHKKMSQSLHLFRVLPSRTLAPEPRSRNKAHANEGPDGGTHSNPQRTPPSH